MRNNGCNTCYNYRKNRFNIFTFKRDKHYCNLSYHEECIKWWEDNINKEKSSEIDNMICYSPDIDLEYVSDVLDKLSMVIKYLNHKDGEGK